MRKERRRVAMFPVHMTINMAADLKTAIEKEADATDLPASEVARQALARGLPLVRDARRKRRGRGGGRGAAA